MTARVLSDALPFIQAHADRTVVIKYGGHAMEDEEASLSFAKDVVMLKQVLYGIHCLPDMCFSVRPHCVKELKVS